MANDVTKEHAEWLGLIETEGPFLSLPVLLEEFPQGLNRINSGARKTLRLAHEAWLEDPSDPRKHLNWIEQVLRGLLEHTLREPSNWDTADWYLERFDGEHPVPESLTFNKLEHGETIAPRFVIRNPDDGPESERVRMLVMVYDRRQSLSGPVHGSSWKDRPATRAAELCRSCGVQLALVTNGHQWMVVDAPSNHTLGTAMWRSELFFEEPCTLQAFYSLFGQVRFFSVEDSATPEQLLSRSRNDQYEVTDQLGYQVRQAIEILVGCLQRADRDLDGSLLKDVPPDQVYEASVSIMMRLIVLLCAEERDLLPLGEPLYDNSYAVSTLGGQLREVADEYGEGILEARQDAWSRLLALFRMVHSGVGHDRLSIAAYGGSIFDPDRFPFLEGRAPGTSWQDEEARPLPIDNRTVLHILESLQWLQISIGGEKFPRKLSFKALGIEQIGHVYEGLLDHNAVRANEPVLGLVGKDGEEPEVKLSSLEGWVKKGGNTLANELKKLGVGSSAPVVKRKLEAEIDESRLDKIHGLCDAADASLWDRVKPFVGVIRDDTFGHPIVVPTGGVFVTQGTDRRSSGSHYTTRDLTEPIVERTLEPQVFVGPAEGHDQADWKLKSPAELLELKIVDPACGSGAFLVQSCRYLADRLVESWAQTIEATGGHIDIKGRELSGRAGEVVVPEDDAERTHLAQRLIVQRCLYGVDKNHLAVEMAKLSLWLLILAKDEPFTFLDHAIKCGDSLVGLTGKQISQMTWEEPETGAGTLFAAVDDAAAEAAARREEIESIGVGHEDEKALLHRSAEAALEDAKLAGDTVIAAFFKGTKDNERRDYRNEARSLIERWRSGKAERMTVEKLAAELAKGEHPLSPFHWELEFPEVFGRENSGFDAVVGNPPFAGKNTVAAGSRSGFQDWLKAVHAESHGNADLCAHFFRRAFDMLRQSGGFGLIATNTIAQGDTRNSGLRWICTHGGEIYCATKRVKWPGKAAVMVSLVHAVRGSWGGGHLIDGRSVRMITAFLNHAGGHEDPRRLEDNKGKSFTGSIALGMGFTFDDSDSKGVANSIADMNRLITANPRNQEVIFPYIGGKEINSSPTHAHHRFIINFSDYSEEICRKNWPELMAIVEEKVRPEREAQKNSTAREQWWIYYRRCVDGQLATAGMQKVLVHAFTSKYLQFAYVPRETIVAGPHSLFALEDYSSYSILQSLVHEVWVRFTSSTMKDDLGYKISDSFETFPFPKSWDSDPTLEAAGQAYYEYRADLMVEYDEGLTQIYNRFHDPDQTDPKILKLRELHAAMDRAVLDAYGWDDISTKCEFVPDYEPQEGETAPVRYRWPEAVHDELLARLLELNQQRYEAEVAEGLHTKNTSKKTTKKSAKKKAKADTEEAGLFES